MGIKYTRPQPTHTHSTVPLVMASNSCSSWIQLSGVRCVRVRWRPWGRHVSRDTRPLSLALLTGPLVLLRPHVAVAGPPVLLYARLLQAFWCSSSRPPLPRAHCAITSPSPQRSCSTRSSQRRAHARVPRLDRRRCDPSLDEHLRAPRSCCTSSCSSAASSRVAGAAEQETLT